MTTKPKFKQTIICVEGPGVFPFDMMRYDNCCPDAEQDSARIERATHRRYRVVLRRYSLNGGPATWERWESFGWTVVGDSSSEHLVRLAESEVRDLGNEALEPKES